MNDFSNFLLTHFPHRWLDRNAEGTQKLFSGLGEALAYASSFTKLLKRNHSLRSAEEALAELENEYGLTINPSLDASVRRGRIIAKMRLQDSPVTKSDLLGMLAALDFDGCDIVMKDRFNMLVRFAHPEKGQGEMKEMRTLLEENVRAHILFELNAVVSSAVKNENTLLHNSLKIPISVVNLGLSCVRLDGRRRLLGDFRLFSQMAGPRVSDITYQIGVKNEYGLRGFLTEDTVWRLSGEALLDGTKLLNAFVKKTEI